MSHTVFRAPLALAVTAVSLALAGPASASITNKQDRDYMKESAAGVAFEVKLGTYARQHATTSMVRQQAATYVRDHKREGRALARLGRALGVKLDYTPEPNEQAEIAWVEGHSGRGLDKAYAMVEYSDHLADDATQWTELGQGRAIAVKGFTRAFLPMYLRHLSIAQDVNDKLNPES